MTVIYIVCNNNIGATSHLRVENVCCVPSVHEVRLLWQQTRAQRAIDDCVQKSNSGIFKWSVCVSVAKNLLPWFILFTCLVP